jgi:hypothetical protein
MGQAQRQRSPYASVAGDLTGATLLGLATGNPGAGLAEGWGSGVGARMLGYGLEGAGMGAAQGAGSTYTGNFDDYLKNAAKGGALGLGLGALTGGVLGRARSGTSPQSTAEVPSMAELHASGGQRYDTLGISDARYEPTSLGSRADGLEQNFTGRGLRPNTAPTVFGALDDLRTLTTSGEDVTPAQLESIRQSLNDIPHSASDNEHAAVHIFRNSIDDFYSSPPPGAVRPGTEDAAAEAAQLAQDARGDWSAYRKSQTIANKLAGAEQRADSTASGLNTENTIRQRFAAFTNPDSPNTRFNLAPYTDEEQAALRGIPRRTLLPDLIRGAGNMAAGGGGPFAPIVAGTIGGGAGLLTHVLGGVDPMVSSAVGLAVPTFGMGLRIAGNRSAANAVRDVDEMVRANSPLYAERFAAAPMTTPIIPHVASNVRDAIVRHLVAQQGAPATQAVSGPLVPAY